MSTIEAPGRTAFWMPQPKGYLGRQGLAFLLVLAITPLVSVAVRLLATPGVLDPGWFGAPILISAGEALNGILSLSAVQSVERWTILYLLLLPTCALLIAIVRLTFGLRVLGFRSILIAVGFQQTGIVPSLMLIAVVVGTTIMLRPTLKAINLPYYARVSVILGLSAIVMIGALIVGSILRSEAIWGMAFFPVIVLALLGESVAHTMVRDEPAAAAMRIGTTVGLAFIVASISQIFILRATMLEFPELLISQVVAIILISEFYDLRLLQDWKPNTDFARGMRTSPAAGNLGVAVVRNGAQTGVIRRLERARANKSGRYVQRAVDALRNDGHEVRVIEGDIFFLRKLRKFLQPDPITGEVDRIVFNLADGIQGDGRCAHVAAMCEMAGVAYAGSGPSSIILSCDHLSLGALAAQNGICTPSRYSPPPDIDTAPGRLAYPVKLRPRYDSGRVVRDVQNPAQLPGAIRKMKSSGYEDLVVENDAPGRRIVVSLLGNEDLACLPFVELRAGQKICPAALSKDAADALEGAATSIFRLAGCRDYARVEFALDDAADAKPRFIELRVTGLLSRGGAFALAAQSAGLSYSELMNEIVAVAWARHLAKPAVRKPIEGSDDEVDEPEARLAVIQ